MKIVLTEIRKAGTILTKTVIALSSQKHLIFFNKSITPPNKIGVVVYHMTFSLNTKRRSKFLKTRLRYYPNNDTSFNAKRDLGTLNQYKNHLNKNDQLCITLWSCSHIKYKQRSRYKQTKLSFRGLSWNCRSFFGLHKWPNRETMRNHTIV